MMKPIIAISMGDPAGISPEIIAAGLEDAVSICRPLVFGHYPTMKAALTGDWAERLVCLDTPAPVEDGMVGFVSVGEGDEVIRSPGREAGRIQLEALDAATTAVLDGPCLALVTAPVAKHAIASLGVAFSGHTEYLAKRAGLEKDDVTMVFASMELCVGMVTTHLPLREVPDAVTWKRLDRTFRHVVETRRRIKPDAPLSIAVAALNPHAGEDGMFGTEEQTLLAPFCEAMAEDENIEVCGPLPGDMVYRDALSGKYCGVVAGYHDQALIPLKLGGVGRMVNVTMGLPFIRTSPDHGVAYEIARKGVADPSGLKSALQMAVRLSG